MKEIVLIAAREILSDRNFRFSLGPKEFDRSNATQGYFFGFQAITSRQTTELVRESFERYGRKDELRRCKP